MKYVIQKKTQSGWVALSVAMPRNAADKRVRQLILGNPQERYRLATA
jgi:hypothetical protein